MNLRAPKVQAEGGLASDAVGVADAVGTVVRQYRDSNQWQEQRPHSGTTISWLATSVDSRTYCAADVLNK